MNYEIELLKAKIEWYRKLEGKVWKMLNDELDISDYASEVGGKISNLEVELEALENIEYCGSADPAKIVVVAEKLVRFENKTQWINKAKRTLGGFDGKEKIVAIDKNGNACVFGAQFSFAEESDLYPITGYRLVRNDEGS